MSQVSSLRFAVASSVLGLCLIGGPFKVQAQAVAVAQVSGTVSDPSGSAIVGAQVTMTETDKQLERVLR